MPSILNSDDGVVSGTSGLKTTGGNDGITTFQQNGTEQMRITATGNVGIGTSSPTAKVHISQSGASTSLTIDGIENPIFATRYAANADGATIFLAKSRNATVGSQTIVQSGDQIGVLQARGSNGTNFIDAASIVFAVDGTPGAGNDMPGRIVFNTTPDGSGSLSERARIDSDGNFRVGTTGTIVTGSESVSFGKVGPMGMVGSASTTLYSLYIQNASGSGASSPMIRFSTSNGVSGTIISTSTSTTYATSSDYRLKENVQPMTGALVKVAQLKPCTYKWKADGRNGEGFIAHELQAVCPDAVTGHKDEVDEDGSIKPQGIDTSFLVATLTAAIQELNAKVEAQAAEIAALKGAQA